jgi:L-alanine-DL-glutamate epimerase-like enolase superfamily enzyme
MMRRVDVRHEVLPLRTAFSISRGTRTEISVVVVEITDGAHVGRGECFPHSRYGESVESVQSQIAGATGSIASSVTRDQLLALMPNGAARNAIDCALWDLETKIAREQNATIRAWQLAGLDEFRPVQSVMTISLDDPEAMAAMISGFRPFDRLPLTHLSSSMRTRVGGHGIWRATWRRWRPMASTWSNSHCRQAMMRHS